VEEHVIVLDVVDSSGAEAVDFLSLHVSERLAKTPYLPKGSKRNLRACRPGAT